MLNKNDMIDIRIDDLTVDGAGVGRYNGFAVFVPHALPDETVSAKIIKVTKNYAVSRLINIIEPSQHRITPFCTVFEKCGGCTLQHLDYTQQLLFKSRHVQQCFSRIGGINIGRPVVSPSPNVRDYRNKASFPVSDANGHAEAGFFAPRSHRLVPSDCPIQKPAINDIKNAVIKWANDNSISAYDEKKHTGTLRHIIGRQTSTGDIMAGIVVRHDISTNGLADALQDIPRLKGVVVNINGKKGNAILSDKNNVVFGAPYITERYDGLKFRVGLTSFLQVNHAQSERLYKTALRFADIQQSDIVYDLFCGIGTISLLAANKAHTVLGIEYGAQAAQNAADNAALNNIRNAVFLAGDAGEKLAEGVQHVGEPDIVILDPPRKGCDSVLIDRIAKLSPRKIVYVSCNPATLARDAAQFSAHGYAVSAVEGADMFPHTTHVECVIMMTNSGSN